jgi:transposase-like protein
MKCKYCGSENLRREGKFYRKIGDGTYVKDVQRYRCRDCGRPFNENKKTEDNNAK